MKKIIFFLTTKLICISIFAQTSMSIAGFPAYVQLPGNFSSQIMYPALVFFPGAGEAPQGLAGLKVHGPELYATVMSDSAFPIIIVSVSPNNVGGFVNSNVQSILTALRSIYPNISKIYGTGLSLGGGNWQNYIWSGNEKQVSGVFLFSSETPSLPPYGTASMQYSLWKTDSTFWYGGVGGSDNFYNALPNCMLIEYDSLLAYNIFFKPYLDVWLGVGHGDPVWSNGYNPSWNSPSMGMSIYRKVMQLCPAYSITTGPVPNPTPTPSPSQKSLVYVINIAVYSDSSKVQSIIK